MCLIWDGYPKRKPHYRLWPKPLFRTTWFGLYAPSKNTRSDLLCYREVIENLALRDESRSRTVGKGQGQIHSYGFNDDDSDDDD